MKNMHPDELAVNLEIVKELIGEQFPEYSMLPITDQGAVGTVNNIYRLGQDLYIRIPRVMAWADIDKEFRWLPYLAPHLTLRIPEPVALGEPSAAYPAKWAIYRWIEGKSYSDELICDENEAAIELANFVNQLRSITVPREAPKAGRLPLPELYGKGLEAIRVVKGVLDTDRIIEVWDKACHTNEWDGHSMWIHTDLLRTNLLVHAGRLVAVIDFGSAGVGDPAFDLIPSWSVFTSRGRETFQKHLNSDSNTWMRARGYALYQALLIIPYYRRTYPAFVRHAVRTINEILEDRL
jgi:aminoglycoside phosphotransferase (APT) family kinase protein